MTNTTMIAVNQPATFLNFQEETVQTMDLATLKKNPEGTHRRCAPS